MSEDFAPYHIEPIALFFESRIATFLLLPAARTLLIYVNDYVESL